MRIVPLHHSIISDWVSFLPENIYIKLMQGNRSLHAAGVMFLREPQGAIVWEEREEEWILLSIYIARKSRRLELGSALVAHLSEEMSHRKCPRLSVTYAEQGERRTLTPFLCRCGFMMESLETPLGVTTLQTIQEALDKSHILQKKGKTKPLYQLTGQENRRCNEWFFAQTGETIYRYMGEDPTSFVLMQKEEVAGIVLLSKEEDTISLDYCFIVSGLEQSLFLLLADAVDWLHTHYSEHTRIEVILSTIHAQRLYSHLLGETQDSITLCKGSFSPVPSRFFGVSF